MARATHFTDADPPLPDPVHLRDRLKCWELLSGMVRDKSCWSCCKPFQRSKNGRAAIVALKNHHLGPNDVDDMANVAERQLETACCKGETKRWTFEKCGRLHVDQHTILNNLRTQGHAGIDERSKV